MEKQVKEKQCEHAASIMNSQKSLQEIQYEVKFYLCLSKCDIKIFPKDCKFFNTNLHGFYFTHHCNVDRSKSFS